MVIQKKTVKLKFKTDEYGKYKNKTFKASVQDMSSLDDVKMSNLSYTGEKDYNKFVNELYNESVRNYKNPESKVIDFDKHAEKAKEGKFTKTDEVPVFGKDTKGIYLKKTSGYMTKVNGEVFYLQKRGSRGWVINYNGLSTGRTTKSLNDAKSIVNEEAQKVLNSVTVKNSGIGADTRYVSANKGHVAKKLFDKFQKDRR